MAAKQDSLVQRVQKSYRQLQTAADSLNQASDKLGESITALNDAVKSLNLGVSSWVEFEGEEDKDQGFKWHNDIGFTKLGGKWTFALRSASHDYGSREPEDVETWTFNDAPRVLRVSSVKKIPDLLDALVKTASEMGETVAARTRDVDLLAEAITAVANEAVEGF